MEGFEKKITAENKTLLDTFKTQMDTLQIKIEENYSIHEQDCHNTKLNLQK